MELKRLATCILAVAAMGCSTLQVNTDYAPGTDFTRYKSFTLKRGEAGQYQIAADRLMAALENALKARGFASVPDGGDLNVFVHVTLGKDTQIVTTGYGYGGWGGSYQVGPPRGQERRPQQPQAHAYRAAPQTRPIPSIPTRPHRPPNPPRPPRG